MRRTARAWRCAKAEKPEGPAGADGDEQEPDAQAEAVDQAEAAGQAEHGAARWLRPGCRRGC